MSSKSVSALLAALWLAGASAIAQSPPAQAGKPAADDEAFLSELGDRTLREPVDRRRLAKLFFSIAATLDGGKSSVRLLQTTLVVPAPSRQTARAQLESQFGTYSDMLARFQRSVSELLDEPDSSLRLYRVLSSGERVCWQLDSHTRLLDSYGLDRAELMPILSSLESCARFRTLAFKPRVEGLIAEALLESSGQREEIRRLKADVHELERLVEDLRQIDAGP